MQDRNSQQRTLRQVGQCSDGPEPTLPGPHTLEVTKLAPGATLDCGAHTLASLDAAVR